MRAWLGTTLGLTFAVAAGCGTKHGEELFGYGDSGGAGAGGRDRGSGLNGSGLTGGGSTSDSSGSSSAKGSAQSSNAQSSSAQSSVASSSTGPDPSNVTVYCKNAPCGAGQVCCFHFSDPDQDHCGAAGSCGNDYITLSCNGPEDCPNGDCCGDWSGGGYQGISCVPRCSLSDVLMCEGNSGICPQGESCFPSQTLGEGYSYCQ